ncbi:unnamed protein product [Closterium sp. Yama58-4]|nr:unnamed protein product [Closterium sp. Yama58-4]
MRLIGAAWLAARRCQRQAREALALASLRNFSAIQSPRALHSLHSPPLTAASPPVRLHRILASGESAQTPFSARIAAPSPARIASAAPLAQEGSAQAARVTGVQGLEGKKGEGKRVEGVADATKGTSAAAGMRVDHGTAPFSARPAQHTYAPTTTAAWQGGRMPPTAAGEKPRVVVLGSGWAACRFLRDVDTRVWDVVCVSSRNHMVFTPLLASTCVGTLEFRSVAEPVEHIQPAVSHAPSSFFFLATCTAVHLRQHQVTRALLPRACTRSWCSRKITCEYVDDEGPSASPLGSTWRFSIAYDKLVVAVGAQASTFGIRGVEQHALFLREVRHAQTIRRRLLLNLMKSDTPVAPFVVRVCQPLLAGLPEEEKRRLLSCVVVGGGPTGVEFSGELSDFIRRDVRAKYAHVKDYVHVTLIELTYSMDPALPSALSPALLAMQAHDILSSFDVSLRDYAVRHLTKSGVSLKRGQVAEVTASTVVLTDGSVIPYGLLVWSTGPPVVPVLPPVHLRIAVMEGLRVVGEADVFALGDCAGFHESTGCPTLPALAQVGATLAAWIGERRVGSSCINHGHETEGQYVVLLKCAQVAERQGRYLAVRFNRMGKAGAGKAGAGEGGGGEEQPFVYRHLGSMATVGRYKALVDLQIGQGGKRHLSLAGFASWFIWRSAYLTRVISWRNRLYVAVNWATTLLFGRDISRI